MDEINYISEVADFTIDDWKKVVLLNRYKLLHGEWLQVDTEEIRLREIAKQYHDRCDLYDRSVCTGISPRSGEAIPVTGEERSMVNAHARQRHREAVAQGFSAGFTEQQVVRAIQRHVRDKQ